MDSLEYAINPRDTTSSHRPSLPKNLQDTAGYILSVQRPDGAIAWFAEGKLDPWDHIEAAMGLSVAGHLRQAERAYAWLRDQQLADGGWQSNYFCPADEFTPLRQTHFMAYIATGVWHHYLVTRKRSFLETLFPCVERAMDAVLRHQSPHGDIAWAYDESPTPLDDALLTGCSSTLRSLSCAVKIAETLTVPKPHWRAAIGRLRTAICSAPHRFDRHWQSKQRFAMDWYYPVLSGAYSVKQSAEHLERRWSEFVEAGLGCRCVSDEPWVTMAETSELIIALVASGKKAQAEALFNNIQQWRHADDGGYWTGYVFRDDTIWPEEKTTWTAAAVILAADALYAYSPAHGLFTTPLEIATGEKP